MGLEAPVIAAIVSAATTVAATGAAGYASYQQGTAQEKLNNYNARVLQQQASERERDARINANAARDENVRLMQRQRALFSTAGVSGTEGTPLMVAATQAAHGELDALEIERAGGIEAGNMRQQSLFDRLAGKEAARAGRMGAVGAGLNMLGGVAAGYGKAYAANDRYGKPAKTKQPSLFDAPSGSYGGGFSDYN